MSHLHKVHFSNLRIFPSNVILKPGCIYCVLGRYCETHQMTGNFMWDQASMKEFLIGLNADSRLRMWWDGSEPIWVTMQKLNKNVYMYYWPGEHIFFKIPSLQHFGESEGAAFAETVELCWIMVYILQTRT